MAGLFERQLSRFYVIRGKSLRLSKFLSFGQARVAWTLSVVVAVFGDLVAAPRDVSDKAAAVSEGALTQLF